MPAAIAASWSAWSTESSGVRHSLRPSRDRTSAWRAPGRALEQVLQEPVELLVGGGAGHIGGAFRGGGVRAYGLAEAAEAGGGRPRPMEPRVVDGGAPGSAGRVAVPGLLGGTARRRGPGRACAWAARSRRTAGIRRWSRSSESGRRSEPTERESATTGPDGRDGIGDCGLGGARGGCRRAGGLGPAAGRGPASGRTGARSVPAASRSAECGTSGPWRGRRRPGVAADVRDQLVRQQHQRAGAAARGRPERHRQAVLAGQPPDHREAEPWCRRARRGPTADRLADDGPFGAAQLHLAHDQTAVLDGDDRPRPGPPPRTHGPRRSAARSWPRCRGVRPARA